MWLDKAADESYVPVRDAFLCLFKKAPQEWRRYVPLEVRVGAVRFYFEDPLTDEEFGKHLRKAIEVADSLPETGLEGIAGPGEFGLEWNENSQSWYGDIYLGDPVTKGYLHYSEGQLHFQGPTGETEPKSTP